MQATRVPVLLSALVLRAAAVAAPAPQPPEPLEPPTPAEAADEAALQAAVQQQLDGHAWAAQAQLRRLAEAGQVPAMERLALLHWYGAWLYPGEPWSRELAVQWFARAAVLGSELGRHMTAVARQAQARDAAAAAAAAARR